MPTTRDAPEAVYGLFTDKSLQSLLRYVRLGKAGPEPELYRISYGYVSRASEAAAEAILALSFEAFQTPYVSFGCM